MTKQINTEWITKVLNENNNKKEFTSDLPQIDWVSNGKAFKKDLRFKLVGANSKENQIFAHVVGTHWNLGPNKDKRFLCPETTAHLKGSNVVCPVCEMKRQLLALGFTEEDLTTQGKFGPLPVFDPTITSNVKVVVMDTDLRKDWDQAHISVLQQKGSFLTKWLAERYIEQDTPDLLLWEKSNIIKFSRPSESARWDREISFASYAPSLDVIMRLKEENEALTLPELWAMPSDQQILEIKQVVDMMKEDYVNSRNTIKNAVASIVMEDEIPF